MAKAPNIDRIVAQLSVLERVLLFRVASGTDYAKVGVTLFTVQHLLVRNLVARNHTTPLMLTEHGRAVLAALLKPSKE
jgi:hypothetical protein